MPRGRETIRVIPSGGTDSNGDPLPDAPEPYDVQGCHVLPRYSTETENGQVIIDGKHVIAPATIKVPKADAQIEYGGLRYEIDGVPGVYPRRIVEIFLKRVGA